MDKRYSWMPRANVPVREQHLVLAFRQTRVRVAKVPLGALQVTRVAGRGRSGRLARRSWRLCASCLGFLPSESR